MQEDEHSCNTELCLGLNEVKFVLKNKQKRDDLNKDDDNYRRKKLKLTKEQTTMLEDTFKLSVTLNSDQKFALAEQLNLQPRQVEVWFQNKRARTKQKKTEAESEFLEKCCVSLSKQNQILKKEVQRLQALQQLAVPSATLYGQFASSKLCAACENTTLQAHEVKPAKAFGVVGHAIKLESQSSD